MNTRNASFVVAAVLALLATSTGSAQTAADTQVKSMLPTGTPAPSRPPPVFPPGQALAPMARATIFVGDLEKSLRLYRDILGLTPMFDNAWKGKGINDIMGTKGLELRSVVLMAGNSGIGNIGLYQLSGSDVKRQPKPSQTPDTRIGDFAVIFPTNDIWGMTKKIQAAGYVIVSPPVSLLDRPNMKQQALEMMFRDDDGVLVNLVQAGIPADK
jgi:catechol 2,3-dioxygenase-like lactoylglutathione lyase family enzyme